MNDKTDSRCLFGLRRHTHAGDVSLRADLIPGAAQTVRELKRRGYSLALVADGPTATFANNLAPYGLYELFDAYAISEEVGGYKARTTSTPWELIGLLEKLEKDAGMGE